jgi:hypothetical protein
MNFPMANIARSTRVLAVAALCGSALALAGCDDRGGDPTAEIGPNPKLPDLQQYLFPQMHVAKIVGWKRTKLPPLLKG